MMSTKENCPLCQNKAEYIPHDFGRFKIFNCEKCKVFVVNCDLIEDLIKLSPKGREALSIRSGKCTNEKLLVISVEEGTSTFISDPDLKNNW